MLKQYVMTVMATNRVGILAAISTALDELGGGFVDLSIAVLRRYFTIIMAVEFPADRDPLIIQQHLEDVCRPFGVSLMLRDPADADYEELSPVASPCEPYLLRLSGPDTRGVLRRVAFRLAQDGINVADLYGTRDDQSKTFASCLHLDVPRGVSAACLFRDLDQMLSPEGVRVGLHHDRVLEAVSRPGVDPLISASDSESHARGPASG
jgi:glycine cleavage system transcriptional repressor